MNYYDDYITNIYIIKFEKDLSSSLRIDDSRKDKRFLQYTLIDAYPKQINSMDLSYGPTDEFIRFNVTFGYSRYVRERVTVPQLAQSNTGTDNVTQPRRAQRQTGISDRELREAQRQSGFLDLNNPYFGTLPRFTPPDGIQLA